jgi:hypothetical protein
MGPLGIGSPPYLSTVCDDIRYYDLLRLPQAHFESLYVVRSLAGTFECISVFVSLLQARCRSNASCNTRYFIRPVYLGYPVFFSRRQVALPSSRAILVITCPVLRPRWCPAYLPWRIQDCCFPTFANCQLWLGKPLPNVSQ